MNLNELIAADCLALLTDSANGRADSIAFTSPLGVVYSVLGWINAMGIKIDPGTGQAVPGSSVEVTVALASLTAMPDNKWRVVVTRDGAPWISGYVDGEGLVDRTIGRVSFVLRGVSYA